MPRLARLLVLVAAGAMALTACTTPPEKIEPAPVSRDKYLSLNCEQLAAEGASLRKQIATKRNAINAANDVTKGPTGIVAWAVLWPDLLLHRATVAPESAAEYSRLLGEYRALSEAFATKGCSPATGTATSVDLLSEELARENTAGKKTAPGLVH